MRFNRMAPPRFVHSPAAALRENRGLWRGLRMALVPLHCGVTPSSGTTGGVGRELINGMSPTANGGVHFAGEACGPAMGFVNAALGYTTQAVTVAKIIPNAVPFSVFAFLVRRDASATTQSLCGNGYLGNGGWTFQLNYGAGQIGLTRWGIADNPSTTLGAVPNTGGQASGVGMTLDGTNVRFFLNGRFQSIASGTVNLPTSTGFGYQVGANANAASILVNSSVYVLYTWNRVLSDAEMLALWADPWAPVRPAPSVYASVASTPARATQLAVEAWIASAPPAVRETQLALEALIAFPIQTRATQVLIEALIAAPATPSTARLSTLILEAFTQPNAAARFTQLATEILLSPIPGVRVTQVEVEALLQPDVTVRATQVTLEALVQVAALTPTYTGQLFPRGSPLPF